MKRSHILALALCSALGGCKSEPAPEAPPAAPADPAPTLRLPSDAHPTAYTLALDIDPKQPRFSGHATIAVQLDQARQQIWLHGRGLHVSSATVTPAGGAPIKAGWEELPTDGFARLALPKAVGPGAVSIDIAWDAPFNDRLVGLYKTREQGIDYAYTQFEAIDARWAFPCFDEPLFKTPFDVTLTVPADDVAVANALQVEEKPVAGGKKSVRFATTKPLPTYLVAFAVGPFDVVEHAPLPPNEVRKRPLPFRGITPKGRGPEIKLALDAAAGLLAEEERYFGIEYPFDKLDHIAVPEFAYGAMENAGAITYREEALLYVPGKSPFTLLHRIYNVMAHEMAHQWFGDLVTLRWWTDAWLNESFATWMAARTVDAWDPKQQERIDVQRAANNAMTIDALAAARAIRQPVNNTGDIWNQFDSLTYQKGAAVLAMLEGWIGEEKFRAGVSSYLRAHAFGGGSTDDLLLSYSKAAGRDVAPAFHSFIGQAGVPLVEANLTCDAGKATVALQQTRFLPLGSTAPHDQRWQIPTCVRSGQGAKAQQACTLLSEPTSSLPIEGACPEWVMPNGGGVGYYRWSVPGKQLIALSQHWAQLLPRERLSFAYNVHAGMQAGTLDAGDAFRVLTPAARDSDALVAMEPSLLLVEAYHRLVEPAQQPRVTAYFETLYHPVIARLGWTPKADENSATRELREELIDVGALDFRDPALRKQALAKGQALFDVKTGTLHLNAVDPDLRRTALAVLVQEEGAPAFDAIVAQLDKITDTSLHQQMVDALLSTTDEALFARALDVMIGPHVSRGDRIVAYAGAARLWGNRPRLLAWLPAHIDALVASMPETSAARLPFAFRGLSDPAQSEAVRALFEPREAKIGSLKRNLEQAREAIALNAAYIAKQKPSAIAFFSAPPNERAP